MEITKNPILSGFYPDPSVCMVEKRDEKGTVVGADYYLVNSTFAYVPGVPVFHSKNLQDWTQIGHVLERPEQFKLDNAGMSEGIFAPVIRYHKGTYYMITTNVSDKGNFYVTAKCPQGPWSDPVWLEGAEGIDPSLYFEDDTCYYVGQRTKKDAKYFGDCEIWIQELDLQKGKLVGEAVALWDGVMKHAIWPEGPHLYKRGDYYYLLIAEGGTEYSHSICVARSKDIKGPYEGCPNNPIFTHRHLGHAAKVQNVGHGDLVETPTGEWYIVMLATRPEEGCAPLGRETFLAKVAWEEDWPVINPGIGCLTEKTQSRISDVINWSEPFDMRCVFYGHPKREMYRLEYRTSGFAQSAYQNMTEEPVLALKTGGSDFGNKQTPTYVGIRVTDKNFSVKTTMQFAPGVGEEAGLVYLYDEKNYVKLMVSGDANGTSGLLVKKTEQGKEEIVWSDLGNKIAVQDCLPITQQKSQEYELELCLKGLSLECKVNNNLLAQVDVRALSSEIAGGFVGCTMGIYAGSIKTEQSGTASDKSIKKADNYARFSELQINCEC